MHCELNYKCTLLFNSVFSSKLDSSYLDRDTVDTHTNIDNSIYQCVYYRSYIYYTYTVHYMRLCCRRVIYECSQVDLDRYQLGK